MQERKIKCELYNDNFQRGFKGVWIPAEIYLDERLSWTERILLIEIDTLDNEEGCFASNEYFAEFLRVSKVSVSTAISNLKKYGYIKQEGFNGRQRVLKSKISFQKPPEKDSGITSDDFKADLKKTLRQTSSKLNGRLKENLNHNNIVNNTDEYIKEIYKEKKKERKISYGEYSHVKLTEKQYEKLVSDFGQKNTDEYIRRADEYCQEHGKKYNDFNLTIRKWLRTAGIVLEKEIKDKYKTEDDFIAQMGDVFK